MITNKINNINQELKSKLVKQEQATSFRVVGMILRILFGVVFIYSGFVKAIDPLGHTYKMLDYFQAMGLPQVYYPTLVLSILMIALEFAIGLGMITGIYLKIFSWSAFGFMLVMTPLTLWLALTNAVSDCGCFGDAIKLSNWATFWKNIVLMAIIVAILYFEKYHKPYLSPLPSSLIAASFFGFSVAISWYCLLNLPLIDYLPYKVGNNIPEQMKIPDGAPLDDAPWNDTINWEYVSQNTKLIKRGYEPPVHDFLIFDPEQGDITEDILTDSNYVVMFVMYDLSLTNEKAIEDLNQIYVQMSEKGYRVVALTASSPEEIDRFAQTNNTLFPFCEMDAIPLKTMIRANPGVIIIKQGTVVSKWNGRNSKKSFEQFLQKNNV